MTDHIRLEPLGDLDLAASQQFIGGFTPPGNRLLTPMTCSWPC